MTLLLRALRVLVTAALVATLICKVAVGLLPATGQVRVAHELTGSMRPMIPIGGLIVYRPLSASELKRREVISYHRVGYPETVTHRIVSVSRSGDTLDVITRGDANNAADPPITFTAGQTVWRVALVLPAWVGAIVFSLFRHGTLLILCLMPLEFLLPWIRRQLVAPTASVSTPSPVPTPSPEPASPM